MERQAPDEDYKKTVREISDQVVAAQKPIRILDAIKWDRETFDWFFRHGARKLPKIDADYYQARNPLQFDPLAKIEEFREIARTIRKRLGQYSGVGSIMQRMCQEYCTVIDLLISRGTPRFTEVSQQLYGSSGDAFHAGAPSLRDMAQLLSSTLRNISDQVETTADEEKITSEEVVAILSKNLGMYFADAERTPRVMLGDGILADAAAGADRLRIQKDHLFSEREVRVFEIHEGWVHLATTLNGMAQPVCTFLGKGPPSSTITQEGLAIIAEIFTFSSWPGRVRRLTNRIVGVNMAEEGANFLDVYRFYLEQGMKETESYHAASRVFRGSTPEGGPFTKDLSYSKGFVLIYNYIRLAVQRGLVSNIALLFAGKTTLEDIHIISDLASEGLIVPPRYVPPQFRDIAALSAWMCYSLFLNQLDLRRLATDFRATLL